jgi:hypothetical protein
MDDCPTQSQWINDDEKAQYALMRVAESLDDMFNGEVPRGGPAHTGFMLLVAYPLAGEERCSVVTNMDRDDLLAMLKLQVARLEGQSFTAGHA